MELKLPRYMYYLRIFLNQEFLILPSGRGEVTAVDEQQAGMSRRILSGKDN